MVSARLNLTGAIPNAQYLVRLIEIPLPKPVHCGAGDSEVGAAVLKTDDSGTGSVVVTAPVGNHRRAPPSSTQRMCSTDALSAVAQI